MLSLVNSRYLPSGNHSCYSGNDSAQLKVKLSQVKIAVATRTFKATPSIRCSRKRLLGSPWSWCFVTLARLHLTWFVRRCCGSLFSVAIINSTSDCAESTRGSEIWSHQEAAILTVSTSRHVQVRCILSRYSQCCDAHQL